MKHLWNVLLLILPVAGIVLLVMSMTADGDNRMLLAAGLLCTSTGSLLNLYLQRRRRKEAEKHE